MQESVKRSLLEEAEKQARQLSASWRKQNQGEETFCVDYIEPKSDEFAIVVYFKEQTMKQFMQAWFLKKATKDSPMSWLYIALTDSHLQGLESVTLNEIKRRIELHNWDRGAASRD